MQIMRHKRRCEFSTCHFKTAVTSKRMIGKGPGWANSLCLTKLFPDLAKFHSQRASQYQLEDRVIKIKLDKKAYIRILVFLILNFNWPLFLNRWSKNAEILTQKHSILVFQRVSLKIYSDKYFKSYREVIHPFAFETP
jgi:hypothetical protein